MQSRLRSYRRGYSSEHFNREFTPTGHKRHSDFDIYRYKRSRRYNDNDDGEYYDDYYRKRDRHSTRLRGGAEFDSLCDTPRKRVSARRNTCIEDVDEGDLSDNCERDYGRRRDRDRSRYRDFDASQERYVNRRMSGGQCYDPCDDQHRDRNRDRDRDYGHRRDRERGQYRDVDASEEGYIDRRMSGGQCCDPCGDQDRDRSRDQYRRKKRSRREKTRYPEDPCDAFKKQRDDPCNVNIHEVSHSCKTYAGGSTPPQMACTPKTCLALKRKNQGGGDMGGECCTCKECPFCLLRMFCVEVLQELAEIKAKQIGGELEGLVYADGEEGKRARPSDADLSRKQKYSEDSLGRKRHDTSDDIRRGRSSYIGQSTDTFGQKRRRRSDEDFDDDYRGRRGRRSEDSFGRGEGRDRYDRDRDRGRGRRGDDGRSDDFDGRGRGKDKRDKDKKDKKKEKEKKTDEPAELPEEVKKELEKARKKAEKEKKKKEEDRAKKALIEERLMKSSQMATKGWVVKKYDGPGRFAEVNVCDFMRLRLESMLAREAAMQRAACCPPQCMPPTCSINPKYCCTSFWCPPPSIPAICC